MIIHLNGMPGVGKQTVAKSLAEKLNARLIDNHLLIDLVTAIHERGSSKYMSMIKRLTDIVLAEITKKPDEIFVFTNALVNELSEDKERLSYLLEFENDHNFPFVQVLLNCDLTENKNRIISGPRKLKGKLTDAAELEELHKMYSIYHPPAEFSLKIDTTNLSADEVSEQIRSYIWKINEL